MGGSSRTPPPAPPSLLLSPLPRFPSPSLASPRPARFLSPSLDSSHSRSLPFAPLASSHPRLASPRPRSLSLTLPHFLAPTSCPMRVPVPLFVPPPDPLPRRALPKRTAVRHRGARKSLPPGTCERRDAFARGSDGPVLRPVPGGRLLRAPRCVRPSPQSAAPGGWVACGGGAGLGGVGGPLRKPRSRSSTERFLLGKTATR